MDVAPPGARAIMIKPTAISGGNWKATAIPKATTGNSTICPSNPMAMALGSLITALKSENLRERPMPNMIRNRENGRMTLVSRSACTFFPPYENYGCSFTKLDSTPSLHTTDQE